MTRTALPRGAFARLGFTLAIGAALAVPRLALAQEGPIFACGPFDNAEQIAQALGGEDFVTLSADQWQFLRGLFIMAPDTPDSLPPGDRAAMSIRRTVRPRSCFSTAIRPARR